MVQYSVVPKSTLSESWLPLGALGSYRTMANEVLTLLLRCSCGHVLRASAGECGTQTTCPVCNDLLEVPSFSVFRKNAVLSISDMPLRARPTTLKIPRQYSISKLFGLLTTIGIILALVRTPSTTIVLLATLILFVMVTFGFVIVVREAITYWRRSQNN